MGLSLAGLAVTQGPTSSIRGWGGGRSFDTESRNGRIVQVDARSSVTAVRRADGRIFVQGSANDPAMLVPPTAPPGASLVGMRLASTYGLALSSTGQILSWGSTLFPWSPVFVPPLPAGLTYTAIAAGNTHAGALRSDGSVVLWGDNSAGQCNVPTLPAGVSITALDTGSYISVALLSDGTVVGWGDPITGIQNVPPLPAGVHYVRVDAGIWCALALRSDGVLVGWGDNVFGQCNVPPLATGLSYQLCSAGDAHCSALRSDGVIVTWGSTIYGVGNPPPIPPRARCIALAAGNAHSVALLSNGEVLAWGDNSLMQGDLPSLPDGLGLDRLPIQFTQVSCCSAVLSDGTLVGLGASLGAPPLPVGVVYAQVEFGGGFLVALRSDGNLEAWGDNSFGQCNVPPLPAGQRYTRVRVSNMHSVALRSDGQAVAFGANLSGEGVIPPLPAGLRYVDFDASDRKTVLVRSDGAIVYAGTSWYGENLVPPLPAGLRYSRVAASEHWCVALRSDGSAVRWGGATWAIPVLPPGVTWVEASGGANHTVLRRSDGEVAVVGVIQQDEDAVLPLEPNTSYREVSAFWHSSVARTGPSSTFVAYALGCAGTLPTARLVPDDTPCIGQTLHVTLFDLPQDVAILAFGWSTVPPLDLSFLGMPGCELHVDPAAFVPLVGQAQQAVWDVPIPRLPQFVGVHFFGQALVLDAGAAGGFGAVVSDAVEGVIGQP